ncbi:MAG: nascent polypeptide-associated complex protein [Candidatus Marsarchaeota archaeon]|jgi:nascent polypeptide-associated complex subunit alpha|nr:nascent polypeptide-associated complex protein [Candidatus Marsarchaeota archaeon]
MMPNLDPRALKRMMDSMGMKSTEIDAERVIIEGKERNLVIENPNVTLVEVQGTKTFQISGSVTEVEKSKVEISEDDVEMVRSQTGITDDAKIRSALEESNGDIAEAIIKLKKQNG